MIIDLDPKSWRSFFDWSSEVYLGHDEEVNIHRILKIRRGRLYVVYVYQRNMSTVKVLARLLDRRFIADKKICEDHSDFLWYYEMFNDRF